LSEHLVADTDPRHLHLFEFRKSAARVWSRATTPSDQMLTAKIASPEYSSRFRRISALVTILNALQIDFDNRV